MFLLKNEQFIVLIVIRVDFVSCWFIFGTHKDLSFDILAIEYAIDYFASMQYWEHATENAFLRAILLYNISCLLIVCHVGENLPFVLPICDILRLNTFWLGCSETIFAISSKKVIDPNGPYKKHELDKNKKCLSVGDFIILFVCRHSLLASIVYNSLGWNIYKNIVFYPRSTFTNCVSN